MFFAVPGREGGAFFAVTGRGVFALNADFGLGGLLSTAGALGVFLVFCEPALLQTLPERSVLCPPLAVLDADALLCPFLSVGVPFVDDAFAGGAPFEGDVLPLEGVVGVFCCGAPFRGGDPSTSVNSDAGDPDLSDRPLPTCASSSALPGVSRGTGAGISSPRARRNLFRIT